MQCVLCAKPIYHYGWDREKTFYYCHEHRTVLPMKKIGLYIGRFQPFHNGHLTVIKTILKDVDEVKVVVGSAQHKGTKENPFDAEERKQMVYAAVEEAGLSGKVRVFLVTDIMWHEKYAEHVLKEVGRVDIVYTAENKMLNKLFSEKGFSTKTCTRIGDYEGTKLRAMIVEGKKWEHMVPPAIVELLKGKLNAKRRLEILFR